MMGIRLSSINWRVVSRTSFSSSVIRESYCRKSTPRNLMAGMKLSLAMNWAPDPLNCRKYQVCPEPTGPRATGQTYDGSRGEGGGSNGSASPSRNPSWDRAPVFVVGLPELPAQRRLFIKDHEQVSGQQHQRRIFHQVKAAKKRRLSQDHKSNPDVHGIAHVAMQRRGDQIFRGCDRGRGAKTAHGKFPRAAEVNYRTEQE